MLPIAAFQQCQSAQGKNPNTLFLYYTRRADAGRNGLSVASQNRYLSAQLMGRQVNLARRYQEAESLEAKLALAEEVVCAVGSELRVFIHRRCGADKVEDIHQETLVGIAKGLARFYGQTEKQFWEWCYHVARNKIADQFRQKHRQEDPWETDALWQAVEAGAADEALSSGERLDLDYALKLLQEADPPCYDYLWSHYILEWDYSELARHFDLSYDAVRMRVKRCLELAQSLVAKRA